MLSSELKADGDPVRLVLLGEKLVAFRDSIGRVGIMHFGAVDRAALSGDAMQQFLVANRAPEYKIEQTNYGYIYAAYRPADGEELYWRVGHFLMPFWTSPPINHLTTNVLQRAFVPLDDHRTMFVSMFKKGAYPESRIRAQAGVAGASQNYPYLPNTTDWLEAYASTLAGALAGSGQDREPGLKAAE